MLLAESEGVMANGKQVLIPTRYTHEMLSTMIGSTREGVSRAFGRLQNEGAVELRRRQICLKDLESTLPLFTYSRDLMAIGLRERAGGENRRGERERTPTLNEILPSIGPHRGESVARELPLFTNCREYVLPATLFPAFSVEKPVN